MARAATSISIRPSCRPAYGYRTTRFRPHDRPSMRNRMIFVPRRARTIPELQRAPSHDRRRPTLHPAPAPAALAHGFLHRGNAFHRRWHGVHRYAEVPAARVDSQITRHRHSGAGADPSGGAPALWRAAAAGRPAGADAARGAPVALRSVYPHDRYAAPWLVDAVGRRLPGRVVWGRAPSGDPAAERPPAYAALERAFLSGLPLLCPDPDAFRSGALPCPGPTRRRIRDYGAGAIS